MQEKAIGDNADFKNGNSENFYMWFWEFYNILYCVLEVHCMATGYM